jgi:hypothetical protein
MEAVLEENVGFLGRFCGTVENLSHSTNFRVDTESHFDGILCHRIEVDVADVAPSELTELSKGSRFPADALAVRAHHIPGEAQEACPGRGKKQGQDIIKPLSPGECQFLGADAKEVFIRRLAEESGKAFHSG